MAERNITAANSVFTLSIDTLYSAPQTLQGYMADRAFETDPIDTGEFVMGVDGKLSAGYTPAAVPMTISLMPDSASSDIFENWVAYERRTKSKLLASGTIYIPGTGRRYTLKRGRLGRVPIVPTAGKVLQGRPFQIMWEDCTPSNA